MPTSSLILTVDYGIRTGYLDGNIVVGRPSAMRIFFLGCGDAFGSGGRHQSGYLVEASDRLFLFDCGPSTLFTMKRAGFDPIRLDAIFLSHLHGDHFGGIPFFYLEYLYQKQRQRPLHVAGPAGTQDRIDRLFHTMYGATARKELPPIEFHILEPEKPSRIAAIDISSFRVPHQIDDISLALKAGYEGKQILFSGDSPWTDRFIEESRGVDLFICECTFYDQGGGNHVRFLTLEENRSRLKCRRLILTHLGEEMLARQAHLPGVFATDGMVIEI